MKKLTAKQSVPKTAPKSSVVDLDLLEKISAFMKENGIVELEVNSSGHEIRLKRAGGTAPAAFMPAMPTIEMPMSTPAPAPKAAPVSNGHSAKVVEDDSRKVVVTSPFVGTFYRAAGPNQDPFVEVGKTVNSGEALCIIEAMKLMNEIESDTKGRISKIHVNNATPVEFGEPLFDIEPL